MFDADYMRLALRLARRGRGRTSPNPMVGAVLVSDGEVIGRGWHRQAGQAHAEIEALRDAERQGHSPKGATLYVTLEPCCTHGRTPPCTEAIIAGGIRRVRVGAVDPNPNHAGRGFEVLRAAGIEASSLAGNGGAGRTCPDLPPVARRREAGGDRDAARVAQECVLLNEAFNHWIVHRTPFVTVKAAMTLDGKIATAGGESKWITGGPSRAFAMKLRAAHDAILVGINTVLADDPSLTIRSVNSEVRSPKALRRIILDSQARTPLRAKVVTDENAALTTIVVHPEAPPRRVAGLARKVRVMVVPRSRIRNRTSGIPLGWLLRKLGSEAVTSLLVEGGGEVNAAFLAEGLAQRVAFFYAPKVVGGRGARRGIGGEGATAWPQIVGLSQLRWRRLGSDLLLQARVTSRAAPPRKSSA